MFKHQIIFLLIFQTEALNIFCPLSQVVACRKFESWSWLVKNEKTLAFTHKKLIYMYTAYDNHEHDYNNWHPKDSAIVPRAFIVSGIT